MNNTLRPVRRTLAQAIKATAWHPLRRVALQPIADLRSYTAARCRADLLAGLTVAVVGVPQAMAFALIAGVAPIYGLYGLMVQLFIGSLFTSVPRLSIGPTNTLSLLTAAVATRLVPDAVGTQYVQLVVVLAFVTSVFQLVLAAARLGTLVRYVSHSVVVGFTAGAGVLIAAKQVPNFMGLPAHRAEHHWPGLIGAVQDVIPVVDQWNWRAMVIGVAVVTVMLICRRISRLVPGAFIAVVIASIIVVVAGWHHTPADAAAESAAQAAVPLVRELPQGRTIPTFRLWSIPRGIPWDSLLGGALALALLGLLEGVAIARSLTARSGEPVNANQEFFTQGITNAVSSFFQCYPGTASFSRSALNDMAGAATRWAGVMTSLIVLMILLVAGPLARFIPLAALAGILIVVACGLIEWRALLRMLRTSRGDTIVCLATFLATLSVSLEYAVFVGIGLNIALYLKRAGRLHVREMIHAHGGAYHEMPLSDATGARSVVFLSLEGDLFFGVADELQERLAQLERSGVRVVVLRLKRTHLIDSTVLAVLDQFARSMQVRGGHVVLCGVSEEIHRVLIGFGLADVIGRNNIFEQRFGVFASAKAAIARARELIGHSIDIGGLNIADDNEQHATSQAPARADTYDI
jgi:SulP family sulfate permease